MRCPDACGISQAEHRRVPVRPFPGACGTLNWNRTREGVPVHVRKPPTRISDFVPWTSACFRTEEARDRFLRVAATLPASDVEVGPMPDESRGALVRWRPGKFLGLNDVAYAHGGKIAVMQRRGARRRK